MSALLVLALTFALPHEMRAQSNSTESPYSRFGIGELSQKTAGVSRGMGNVGIALRSDRFVNPKNPASYAAVDSQTFIFDFSASAGTSWFVEGNNKDARLLGNFEYATLLFPVAHWMSVSAGIMPFSTVGYRFGASQSIDGATNRQYTTLYQGNGNISEAYLGIAFDPTKNFSFGLNGSYLFGSLTNRRTVDFNSSTAYNPTNIEILSLHGFKLDAGVQYGFALSKEHSLTLGLTYSPSLPLASSFVHRKLLSSGTSSTTHESDTITAKNAYHTPNAFGLGLAYQWSSKLLLAADVQYNMWQKALSGHPNYRARDQWQIGLGATYTPSEIARSVWQRMEYRFGLSAENSYITLPSDQVYKGYMKGGISFGLGIPMVDRRSWLDLTFDYNHLFPQQTSWVHENYFRITLGLRFNEGWFRKIRLD